MNRCWRGPIYHLSKLSRINVRNSSQHSFIRSLSVIQGGRGWGRGRVDTSWRNGINEIRRHHILSRIILRPPILLLLHPGQYSSMRHDRDRTVKGQFQVRHQIWCVTLDSGRHSFPTLYKGRAGWDYKETRPPSIAEWREGSVEVIQQSITRNNWISRWWWSIDSLWCEWVTVEWV